MTNISQFRVGHLIIISNCAHMHAHRRVSYMIYTRNFVQREKKNKERSYKEKDK